MRESRSLVMSGCYGLSVKAAFFARGFACGLPFGGWGRCDDTAMLAIDYEATRRGARVGRHDLLDPLHSLV